MIMDTHRGAFSSKNQITNMHILVMLPDNFKDHIGRRHALRKFVRY